VKARAIGDDFDLHVLLLAVIIFDHVGGVVQRLVHDLRIILVDMDGDAMQFAFGEGGRSECHRHQGQDRTATKKAAHTKTPHIYISTAASVIARSKATKQTTARHFRDGPKDQTPDAQLRVGESRDSGFDALHRPGMTDSTLLRLARNCDPHGRTNV
jgi:hypothetical protein